MSNSKDIADLAVEDIKKRKIMGKKKYGVPLRANNGRNAIQDAYEEAQDMMLYLKQRLVEEERAEKLWKEEDTIELEYQLALEVTANIIGHYCKKVKFFKQSKDKKRELMIAFPQWVHDEIKKLQ